MAFEKERLTKESREKIEQSSQNYVEEALDLLSKKESQFHTVSKIWSGIGASCLVVAYSSYFQVWSTRCRSGYLLAIFNIYAL